MPANALYYIYIYIKYHLLGLGIAPVKVISFLRDLLWHFWLLYTIICPLLSRRSEMFRVAVFFILYRRRDAYAQEHGKVTARQKIVKSLKASEAQHPCVFRTSFCIPVSCLWAVGGRPFHVSRAWATVCSKTTPINSQIKQITKDDSKFLRRSIFC